MLRETKSPARNTEITHGFLWRAIRNWQLVHLKGHTEMSCNLFLKSALHLTSGLSGFLRFQIRGPVNPVQVSKPLNVQMCFDRQLL